MHKDRGSPKELEEELDKRKKEVEELKKRADEEIEKILRYVGDRQYFKGRVDKIRRLKDVASTSVVLPPIIAALVYSAFGSLRLLPVIVAIEVALVFWSIILRIDANGCAAEVEKIDFDSANLRGVADPRQRDLTLFYLANDGMSRRYHGLNLSQSRWAFVAGLLCVVAGLLMALGTFYAIKGILKEASQAERIIVAVVGGLSSILTEFVATIVLRVYVLSVRNVRDFQEGLVKGGRLLLGALVAQKMSMPELSDKTLARLSVIFAKQNGKVSRVAQAAPTGPPKKQSGERPAASSRTNSR